MHSRTPVEDSVVTKVCRSEHPFDVPGRIRSCLQEGLIHYSFLVASSIDGLNLPPLDVPPSEMCYVQATTLVEQSPHFQSFLYAVGLERIASSRVLPVITQDQVGSSTQYETVSRIETDLVFLLVLKGRVTGLIYPFIVYSENALDMTVTKTPKFTATMVPPWLYEKLRGCIEELCGVAEKPAWSGEK
ncbi:MAG: hypothetical protein QXZ31_03790 [Thermofilaceae archaeon]